MTSNSLTPAFHQLLGFGQYVAPRAADQIAAHWG